MPVKFYCTYGRTLYRDEYNGYTIFTVKPSDNSVEKDPMYGTVTCKGYIQLLPPTVPLEIEAELKEDEYGRKAYEVINYHLTAFNEKDAVSFLSGNLFDGIGPKAAEKILGEAGDNLFSFAAEPGALKRLVSAGVKEAVAAQVLQKISDIYVTKEVMEFLHPFGGTMENAVKIQEKFNGESLKIIKEKPYKLLEAEIPFYMCDNIAKYMNIPQLSSDRVEALVAAAFDAILTSGSTKASLDDVFLSVNKIEKYSNTLIETNPCFILAEILTGNYVVSKEDGAFYVYKKEVYEYEKESARNVFRLANSSKSKPITERDVELIEKENGISYSDEQRAAFSLLSTPGLKILTGGPGTGKTTVVKGMIDAYEKLYPEAVITLCAPTGCAAKRMFDATGRKSQTVHKLLDIKPFENKMMQNKDEYDQLPADLLILDESSMLDAELFYMILKAVKTGASFLLVGDEDQLPSVGAGNILHDLLKIPEIPRVRLKKVYRQKGDSLIIENSIRIREGNTSLLTGDDYEIIEVKTEDEMQKAAISKIKQYYNPRIPNSTKLFSPTRQPKYKISTVEMNKIAHAIFNGARTTQYDSLVYGNNEFTKGDPVIFTKNDYKLGFYNGETGTVKAVVTDDSVRYMLVDKEGKEITLQGSSLAKVEPAYAITTHKSQGSECDTAIVLMPETPKNMLERSLIYVAATRAKKKNIIICQPGTIQTAIETKKAHRRKTGFQNRINEIFHST